MKKVISRDGTVTIGETLNEVNQRKATEEERGIMTNAKQQHTPGPIDETLFKQIAYMADHPGTLGEAFAYMKRLEVRRAELLEALRSFNDAYSFISENCPQPLTHAVKKARAAIAKATGE